MRLVAVFDELVDICCIYMETEEQPISKLGLSVTALAGIASGWILNPEQGPRIDLLKLERFYATDPWTVPCVGVKLLSLASVCAPTHPCSLDFFLQVVEAVACRNDGRDVIAKARDKASKMFDGIVYDRSSDLYNYHLAVVRKWRNMGSWWTRLVLKDIEQELQKHAE